ncbi:MAG: undecaprenyl-diphosphate phosphatase [Ruminococcaceae bacterium]|nr:undecaprenyl-diphosphate phosphatase [Oscillospiraceae bacterium]
MSILEAILQGIVQGLTEFLPVSSSGHVSLVQHFLGVDLEGAQTFTLFLHFGTLLAVFLVYRKLIWDLICEGCRAIADLFLDIVDLFRKGKGKFKPRFTLKMDRINDDRRMVFAVILASACAILLFLPLFGGLGLTDTAGEEVKTLADVSGYTSEDRDIVVEGICLLGTGVLLLAATSIANRRRNSAVKARGYVDYKTAAVMGVGQCFAAMPGLSRSGTTTTLGMICGTEKNAALQFSFIMSIPAVLAANVLEVVKMDSAGWAEFEAVPTILGIVVAAVSGVLAIAGLKWIVSNDKLNYFGYYCLVVGAIIVAIGIAEHASGVYGADFFRVLFGGEVAQPVAGPNPNFQL